MIISDPPTSTPTSTLNIPPPPPATSTHLPAAARHESSKCSLKHRAISMEEVGHSGVQSKLCGGDGDGTEEPRGYMDMGTFRTGRTFQKLAAFKGITSSSFLTQWIHNVYPVPSNWDFFLLFIGIHFFIVPLFSLSWTYISSEDLNIWKICQLSMQRFHYTVDCYVTTNESTVLNKQNNSQLHGTLYCVSSMPKCKRCFDVCGFPLTENICLSYLDRIGYSTFNH